MKTRKISILIICSTLFFASSFAQRPEHKKPDREKIKALKIAHITEKLNLTTTEAQQFWPVYNEFEAKREALHAEKKALRKEKKSKEAMSDEEIEKNIMQHFSIKQRQLDLEKQYYPKFKAVIPIQKIGKLYHAQHQFKKKLLERIRNHEGKPHPHKN